MERTAITLQQAGNCILLLVTLSTKEHRKIEGDKKQVRTKMYQNNFCPKEGHGGTERKIFL